MKKIDLHGLRHHLVRPILIREIEAIWDTDTDVEIITGYSDRMQKIVTEILDEYKLEYRIGDFAGVNTGFIKTTI